MRPLRLDDVVTGQYKSHTRGGVKYLAYTDDKTVPNDSLTPTFAAAALFIDNARWDGVPFLMKAGKALHDRRFVIIYNIYLSIVINQESCNLYDVMVKKRMVVYAFNK